MKRGRQKRRERDIGKRWEEERQENKRRERKAQRVYLGRQERGDEGRVLGPALKKLSSTSCMRDLAFFCL